MELPKHPSEVYGIECEYLSSVRCSIGMCSSGQGHSQCCFLHGGSRDFNLCHWQSPPHKKNHCFEPCETSDVRHLCKVKFLYHGNCDLLSLVQKMKEEVKVKTKA